MGRKLTHLNFIGGGAKSDVWSQILADVMNVNIRQLRDPIQANARGAAFIAAVGLGMLSFKDIPQKVEFKATYTPNPQNARPVRQDIPRICRVLQAEQGHLQTAERLSLIFLPFIIKG